MNKYPGICCRYIETIDEEEFRFTCLQVYYNNELFIQNMASRDSIRSYSKLTDVMISSATDEWSLAEKELYILENVEYKDFEWVL